MQGCKNAAWVRATTAQIKKAVTLSNTDRVIISLRSQIRNPRQSLAAWKRSVLQNGWVWLARLDK